uniref:Uncharacterized protein n=1 Tax=Anguilla anguilla TaxID=7936 RepID=A0A0E9XFW9_ANGAN
MWRPTLASWRRYAMVSRGDLRYSCNLPRRTSRICSRMPLRMRDSDVLWPVSALREKGRTVLLCSSKLPTFTLTLGLTLG